MILSSYYLRLCIDISLKLCQFSAEMTVDCKKTKKGIGYIGNIAKTESGKDCQRWDSNSPHEVSTSITADKFPDSSIGEAENKCRNPDNGERPWCYTNDPNIRWEYCNVPLCDGKFYSTRFFRFKLHTFDFLRKD